MIYKTPDRKLKIEQLGIFYDTNIKVIQQTEIIRLVNKIMKTNGQNKQLFHCISKHCFNIKKTFLNAFCILIDQTIPHLEIQRDIDVGRPNLL
jgi:hypothetical protein